MLIEDQWFTVELIDDQTYAISEYGHWEKVHSFLLLGKEKAVLIDTGLGIDHIKRITDQLTSLPIMVVTTHVHWDHIGSHEQFSDFYVHELEEDWIVHGIKGLAMEQIRKDIARDITLPVPESFDARIYQPFQGQPAGLLKDGDTINLGERELKILHTPGHSPGHICLYDTSCGYLFSGDLLYEGTIYAFYPTTDPQQLVQSLVRIAELPVRKIFGSHHRLGLEPEIFIEVKKAAKFLQDHKLIKHGTGLHTFTCFSIQF
ncbi:MBL fold metallo-hydrolase [Paenibacillus puldeungensis]|uniref:MBL fold metallo-hydrolase n=1 Tax=Paenibacillus puldeungensis TaxID=696536 RepID=A0ABW3S0H3_9BACL